MGGEGMSQDELGKFHAYNFLQNGFLQNGFLQNGFLQNGVCWKSGLA